MCELALEWEDEVTRLIELLEGWEEGSQEGGRSQERGRESFFVFLAGFVLDHDCDSWFIDGCMHTRKDGLIHDERKEVWHE